MRLGPSHCGHAGDKADQVRRQLDSGKGEVGPSKIDEFLSRNDVKAYKLISTFFWKIYSSRRRPHVL